MTDANKTLNDENMDKAEIYLDAQMQRLKWERSQTLAAKIQMREWAREREEAKAGDRAYQSEELLAVLPAIGGKRVKCFTINNRFYAGKVERVTRAHVQLSSKDGDAYIPWEAGPVFEVES